MSAWLLTAQLGTAIVVWEVEVPPRLILRLKLRPEPRSKAFSLTLSPRKEQTYG
jgi:hypothetical protein